MPSEEEKLDIRLKYMEESINELGKRMTLEMSELKVFIADRFGDLDKGVSLTENNTQNLSKNVEKMESALKTSQERLETRVIAQETRINKMEGFKGKMIGIGVAVSAVLGMVGSAVFNGIFGK
jgi:t-SNARE complex subunit (syntaxin)